jgi:DNA polymerase III subunit gamma/tau
LIDALYEIIGGRWQVQCEVAGQSGVVAPATASTTGPVRPNTPGPVEVTPATATAPPTTGRRNGRSEAGGARQRGSDATASEGASTGSTPTGGDAHGHAALGPASGGTAESGGRAVAGLETSIDEDDWPTPATLGGPPPEIDGSEPPPTLGPTADGGQSRVTPRAAPPSAGVIPGREGTPRAAIAAARAAAAGGGATSARGGGRRTAGSTRTAGTGRAPVPRTGGRRSASPKDDTWPDSNEEPPYDPEFDGPVASAAHVGFDPGDEPDDDADSEAVRQTSEQQALDLLRDALGAEKIAEIDNR